MHKKNRKRFSIFVYYPLLITTSMLFVCTPCISQESAVVEEEGEPTDNALDDKAYTDNLEVDPPLDDYLPPPPFSPPPEEELIIDLKNPTFTNGVILTNEGGVVSAQGIRVQAKRIAYTNKTENGVRVQCIVAEGDLMMEYANRAFVGSKLEFDFIRRTGTLWDGKTFVDIWFLGGDKIELQEDGTFYIANAFVTTCESQNPTWEINAKKMKVSKQQLLSAQNIRFEFFKVPLLWLPSFKSNLRMLRDSPIRYKVVWDKGLGPRLTMRYRFFSWQDLNLFFRLDYRIKRGLGGAIESEYFSPDERTLFVTRNYGARDKTFPDEKGPYRYRFQGLYHTHNQEGSTQFHLTWDKLSDTRMVGDFRSNDFEINTQKRTRLTFDHHADNGFIHISFQPRINRFQSIDQELPLTSLGIRPFALGNSGIIMNNYVNAGYLDYVYATDLRNAFHRLGLKSSTHALRMETQNTLYRPCHFGPLILTPSLGITAIFYGNNPEHHAIGQAIGTYGFTCQTHLYRTFSNVTHWMNPYVHFQGLTPPTAHLSKHFYFDINDGYDQLNVLRVGIRNGLFSPFNTPFTPWLDIDLYTYAFFGNRAFAQVIPKSYLTIGWHRSFFNVKGNIAWNNEEHVWDYANIATEWTVNEDCAFAIEFRHRSRFDWRKANHDNFILDVARPISELLESPLSDGRDTLLSRFFFRLSPKWSCQIQSRHGWGRKNEPRYNAGKIDFFTMLSCSFRLRLSYERMPNDNRFSSAVSLVK